MIIIYIFDNENNYNGNQSIKYILSKTIVLKCKNQNEISLNMKESKIYLIQNKYLTTNKEKIVYTWINNIKTKLN